MIEKWKRYCGGSRLLAWLTLCEAGIWIIVTILSLAGRFLDFDSDIEHWLTLPSDFSIFLTRPWTLLTYMAIHFDVFHLLFNVLWLYWFGKILLYALDDRQLAIYFFGGGIFGGIVFLLASALGFGGGWLCGCSAAVLSVMSGAAILHPELEIRLLLIGNVRLKWVAVVCAILTFIGGGGNQAAHIGGLIWGVSYGWFSGKFKALSFVKERRHGRTRRADKVLKALHDHHTDMERLDMLLDKIRISGYDSLSNRERKELNELSQRVTKKQN